MSSGPLKEWLNEATSINATVMGRAGLCLVAVFKCPHESTTTFIKPCSTEPDFAVSPSCVCPAPLCSALWIVLCSCLCAFTHCRSFYCTHALSHLQLAPESRQISILTLIISSAEISSVFPFAFVYKGQILIVSVATDYF